jgi:hypothetical protein
VFSFLSHSQQTKNQTKPIEQKKMSHHSLLSMYKASLVAEAARSSSLQHVLNRMIPYKGTGLTSRLRKRAPKSREESEPNTKTTTTTTIGQQPQKQPQKRIQFKIEKGRIVCFIE